MNEIGGVFLRSSGSGKALSAWYAEHLGLTFEDFGAALLQWQDDRAEDQGVTVWGAASHDSEWFAPSDATFMINYRVNNLEQLLEQLRAKGVEVLQGPEYHENGIFAWILDLDGNKVELWEPMVWNEKNRR